MTVLMRDNLKNLVANSRTAHAGLLMQRGLSIWEDGEKPVKQKLISTISSVKPDQLYLLAFKRWLNNTYDKPNFANLSAKIDGRLFMGLALGGTLETGAMTQHTYGMPMIAGSSIKGAVRHYAEHLFAVRENGEICYDKDGNVKIQANKQPILDVLFGADGDENGEGANAGYLIWHDAWWIPKDNLSNKPFVGEIVTVHHQKYYSGELKEALDIESSVPNQQIAVQGEFYFSIEGDERWTDFALTLLQDMLSEQGVGAKGSNGYGYFALTSENIKPFVEVFNQAKAQAEQAQKDEELKQATADLNDNQKLIYKFKSLLDESNDWYGKTGSFPKKTIDNKTYDFKDVFDIVKDWSEHDDIAYALDELFSSYLPKLLNNPISKNKNWKERVNELKKKIGRS